MAKQSHPTPVPTPVPTIRAAIRRGVTLRYFIRLNLLSEESTKSDSGPGERNSAKASRTSLEEIDRYATDSGINIWAASSEN
jgi:hypothetical protein